MENYQVLQEHILNTVHVYGCYLWYMFCMCICDKTTKLSILLFSFKESHYKSKKCGNHLSWKITVQI